MGVVYGCRKTLRMQTAPDGMTTIVEYNEATP